MLMMMFHMSPNLKEWIRPYSLLLLMLSLLSLIVQASSYEIILKRNLSKSGFHRDLNSIVSLSFDIKKHCGSSVLMMLETLPPGIYIDPFQVHGTQNFGGPQVSFDRQVDIEAAEFVSREHKLRVFVDIDLATTDPATKDTLTLDIKQPIHARYHRPALDPLKTHTSVTILNPKLYLNCSLNDIDDQHDFVMPYNGRNHKWQKVNYKSDSSRVIFKIPVGQEKDKPLVLMITLLITVIVSAILCKLIMGYPELNDCKEA